MLRYLAFYQGSFLFNLFKVSKITIFLSEMPYSESEPDFSNFVINSLSPKSESDDSESDFNSVFVNLDIYIFWLYIYTLLNKRADDFFYQYS